MYQITRRHADQMKHHGYLEPMLSGGLGILVHSRETGGTELWPCEVVEGDTLDYSDVQMEGNVPGRWREMMAAFDTGDRVKVSHDVYAYFLNVLPPRWMGRGAYVFAEGEESRPYLFHAVYGEYFGQRLTWAQIRERGIDARGF